MGNEHPKDIFQWDDGFWCFREDYAMNFLRPFDFAEIAHGSEEWRQLTAPPAK